MGVARGGLVGLGAVAACALSGCHLDLGSRRDKPAATDAGVGTPARGTPFAELPRSPGSRIARPGASVAADRVTEPSPRAETDVRPPPVSVTVPPPAPAPAPADIPLVAALKDYADGRPAEAAGHLSRCDPATRDCLARLLPAAVDAYGKNVSAGKREEIGPLLSKIDAARNGLVVYAPLDVAKIELASQIDGFSRYRPLPVRHYYAPGDLAEVYVELHNARPAPVGPDGAESAVRLRWLLELTDGRDQPVTLIDGEGRPAVTTGRYDAPPTRGPVRDCHLGLRVVVPRTPGVYTLSVGVQDANRPQASYVSRWLMLRVGRGP